MEVCLQKVEEAQKETLIQRAKIFDSSFQKGLIGRLPIKKQILFKNLSKV